MANRYWVGGSATWDGTAGSKWSDTSGGTGGFSVPTSADDVFFDAASGAVTVGTALGNFAKSITYTGFTGSIVGDGSILIYGNMTLVSGMSWTNTVQIEFYGSGTLTTAGKTIYQLSILSGSTVTLGDDLNASLIGLVSGTFTTNNFNITAVSFSSNNSNVRTINFGSSTVSLASSTASFNATDSTNLTLNAGTSQINLTSDVSVFSCFGLSFHNVSFTSTAIISASIGATGAANSFNNLTFAARSSDGIGSVIFLNDQTINGQLTFGAPSLSVRRLFARSNTIGTTRTLTCAAIAAPTDVDFRDITIAGAAAPVSGTRLGDCKGNSGITFDAPKTVYWNLAGSNNWSATAWATSIGGTPAVNNFPLAQDTAVFGSASPGTGTVTTINAAYNIGTIDMSARTANTMTLATGSNTPTIYGNWVNGTGTTLTGSVSLNFFGRGSQTITSAGATFTQAVALNSPGGSLTLQDAFQSSRSNVGAINISAGIFDANNYNVTLTGASAGVTSSSGSVRTIAVGSGTWTIPGTTAWSISNISGLTVTGTGTISLTSASSKSFNGGGVQTYPAINQGGTGTLTINGSNKFANITNTAIGRVQFAAGDTNIFSAFNLSGTAGNLLPLGSSTTAQTTLQKGSAWQMGANSTDAGNNTGLSFTAGGGVDYLSVSYINGTVVTPANAGNFLFLF